MMSDSTPKRRSWLGKLMLALATVCTVAVIGFFWLRPEQMPPRRALPFDAEDVHEWYMANGFLPDYSYQLKAKITHEQFLRYVSRLGLTPHSDTRRYTQSPIPWLSWRAQPSFKGDWWDPTASLSSAFVSQDGDCWTFAKYENGYLYLSSLDH